MTSLQGAIYISQLMHITDQKKMSPCVEQLKIEIT
jgi:hypothetical protein